MNNLIVLAFVFLFVSCQEKRVPVVVKNSDEYKIIKTKNKESSEKTEVQQQVLLGDTTKNIWAPNLSIDSKDRFCPIKAKSDHSYEINGAELDLEGNIVKNHCNTCQQDFLSLRQLCMGLSNEVQNGGCQRAKRKEVYYANGCLDELGVFEGDLVVPGKEKTNPHTDKAVVKLDKSGLDRGDRATGLIFEHLYITSLIKEIKEEAKARFVGFNFESGEYKRDIFILDCNKSTLESTSGKFYTVNGESLDGETNTDCLKILNNLSKAKATTVPEKMGINTSERIDFIVYLDRDSLSGEINEAKADETILKNDKGTYSIIKRENIKFN